LQRKRADYLWKTIYPAYKLAGQGDVDAIEILELAKMEYSPHANCAECFLELCRLDSAKAKEQVDVCKSILKASAATTGIIDRIPSKEKL